MKLSEIKAESIGCRLVCHVCCAHQPSDIQEMIEKRGLDCTLEIASRRWDCFFCQTKGKFTAAIYRGLDEPPFLFLRLGYTK